MKNYCLSSAFLFLLMLTPSVFARNECHLMIFKAPNNMPVAKFINKKRSKNINLAINQVDVLGNDVMLELKIGDFILPQYVSSGQKYKSPRNTSVRLNKVSCTSSKRKKRGIVSTILSELTLVNSYKAYYKLVAAGASMHRLPRSYIKPLKALGVSMASRIKIGFSPYLSKNPQRVAMTDCNNIYFPERKHVNALRTGKRNEWTHLLLHELKHSMQCKSGGGRSKFAERWFKELPLGVVTAVKTMNSKYLHDEMPLEKAADGFADRNNQTFYNKLPR